MSEGNGLPKGWAEATLGDVLQPLENGKALHHGWSPQCEPQPSPSDDVWGVLKTTAVQDGEYQSEHNKTLPLSLEPRPDLEVKTGDLLLTCAGPRSRCGVPCLVRHTRPRLILSGKMYRFRPYDALLSSAFLEGYLRAKDTQFAIDAMKTGISDSGLNLTHDKFLRLPVRLPPLPEQHRIVEKIEELFSDLDAGVAGLQRAKANLKRYRASVLKSAVEGRLTEEWRKEHPQAEDGQMLLDRILRERREKWEKAQLEKLKAKGKEPPKNWESKYEEPSTPDTSELPELPKGWAWATMSVLAENTPHAISAGPFGTIFKAKDFRPSGIPIIFLRHVRAGQYSTAKPGFMALDVWERLFRDEYSVNGGELLVTKLGEPPGTACLYPCDVGPAMVTPDVIQMRVRRDTALASFLMHYMNSQIGQAFTSGKAFGTTRLRLTLPLFKELPIPLPPLAEQEQIVALVEERLSQIDSAEKTIDAELIRSKRLRQSILKRAFEGKLVPQDPKDEPASVLLERIKANREAEQPKKRAKKATKVKAK